MYHCLIVLFPYAVYNLVFVLEKLVSSFFKQKSYIFFDFCSLICIFILPRLTFEWMFSLFSVKLYWKSHSIWRSTVIFWLSVIIISNRCCHFVNGRLRKDWKYERQGMSCLMCKVVIVSIICSLKRRDSFDLLSLPISINFMWKIKCYVWVYKGKAEVEWTV